MNILFLHGLESRLSDDKRKVLKQFGNVHAPDIDYRNNVDSISDLFNAYTNSKIDCIIGSSMGGSAGFYLSMLLEVPALLFNPALPYRNIEQNLPAANLFLRQQILIVLGGLDTLIRASNTIEFLNKNYGNNDLISVQVRPELEHRIPYEIFREEVIAFFNIL